MPSTGAPTPIDIVIIGVGNPTEPFVVARQNAGYIFANYLANCISMQSILLSQSPEQIKEMENKVPDNFKRPVFERRLDIYADVCDTEFALTEADLHRGPASTVPEGADTRVKKVMRVLIVKPLSEPVNCGPIVVKVLKTYGIENISRRLFVAFDDVNVLRGTLTIQSGSDVRGSDVHRGCKSIIQALGHSSFSRFRMGVGKPDGEGEDLYLNSSFAAEKNEMDLFGHALDLTGQALQHYAAFGDLKATKKKFSASKKIPKTLRPLPGLLFPVDVVEVPKK